MDKEFVSCEAVRNGAIRLAAQIAADGFVPDIIYCSMRGGAYMANAISEYFRLLPQRKLVRFAAVVARSYSGQNKAGSVTVDGWTYPPERLCAGDKILLVDDIFDTGATVNHLVKILLSRGIPRQDIKVAVYDYKFASYKERLPIQPDYWCRRLEISSPEDDRWIHYLSHELEGLSPEERKAHFPSDVAEALDALRF